MSDVEITTRTNFSGHYSAMRAKQKELLGRGGKICRDAIGVYFRWMAQFSPPKVGRVDIEEKYYHRQAQLLPIAVCHAKAKSAEYRQALRDGYNWVVKAKGHPDRFFRGKQLPEAGEKYRHIVNRGLLRWAFVGNLPQAGVAIPKVMRPLATASRGRDLKKNAGLLGGAEVHFGENEVTFRVENKVNYFSPGGWLEIAKRRAGENHDRYLANAMRRFGEVKKRVA